MSTTTDTRSSAVTAYLDAVRLYLSDLPDWDVEDLMADIEQHVLEVASEWDGPLTSVLGDPISFVAEYRASADVPPVTPGPSTPPLLDRIVHSIEQARKGQLWLSLRAFAKDARPGWWALRGYMAASVLMFVISSTSRTTMVDPFVFGPRGVVISLVVVFLSVHLGRRSQSKSWRRWLAMAVNGAVLVAALIMGQQVNDTSYYGAVPAIASDDAYQVGFEQGFTEARGHAIEQAEAVPEQIIGAEERAYLDELRSLVAVLDEAMEVESPIGPGG